MERGKIKRRMLKICDRQRILLENLIHFLHRHHRRRRRREILLIIITTTTTVILDMSLDRQDHEDIDNQPIPMVEIGILMVFNFNFLHLLVFFTLRNDLFEHGNLFQFDSTQWSQEDKNLCFSQFLIVGLTLLMISLLLGWM